GTSPIVAGAARAVPYDELPAETKDALARRALLHTRANASEVAPPVADYTHVTTQFFDNNEHDQENMPGNLSTADVAGEAAQSRLHPGEDVFDDANFAAGESFRLHEPPWHQDQAKHEPENVEQAKSEPEEVDQTAGEPRMAPAVTVAQPKDEPGEDFDFGFDYQDEEDYTWDTTEQSEGDLASMRPAEPSGAPSGLTQRQTQRLQQLFANERLSRLHAAETDLMVWKRYRDESKQKYRAHRRCKRRVGEWPQDQQRRV
ncbi:unnamed protein product, partial [Symbiodinium sp. CCMP2456]